MHYSTWTIIDGEFIVSPNQGSTIENLQEDYGNQIVPCWSLAALLSVLPTFTIDCSDDHYFRVHCQQKFSEWHNNPIDACVAMIERLHKLKVL